MTEITSANLKPLRMYMQGNGPELEALLKHIAKEVWQDLEQNRAKEEGRRATMRVHFTISVKADMPTHDPAMRGAFTEMLRGSAKELYAQLAMLAERSPTITAQIIDDEVGTQQLNLFDKCEPYYSESDGSEG
jgi:hypothetical protein